MFLLIINHHYFRQKSSGKGIYPVSRDDLLLELDKLENNGWKIGSEKDIIRFINKKFEKNEKKAVLTFDDGLKEQLDAINLLNSFGYSAICYVPTFPINNNKILEVHKLHMIRSILDDTELANELDKEFSFFTKNFDNELITNQYKYDDLLAKKIKYFLNFMLNKKLLSDWVQVYFEKIIGKENKMSKKMYMNKKEIKMLGINNQLGSHSNKHIPLTSLQNKEINYELFNSKTILEQVSGVSINGLSYPYGGKTAINLNIAKIGLKNGYKYGLTMKRGVNDMTKPINPMMLNRIDVNDIDHWI